MPVPVHNGFHQSEEGYRLLFDANPQPMWIYDRDTLAFLAVNDAACEHYGYSREEFLRMTLKEIRPPEDTAWLLQKIAAIKPGMNSASSRHLKKDGTLIKVEIVSHTLQFEGRRAELVLAMDISDGKPSEFGRDQSATRNRQDARPAFEDRQLTDAENRVARLVAQGFSNKQIAAALALSVRTVENQISRILLKKSFANRVEIARHVLSRAD